MTVPEREEDSRGTLAKGMATNLPDPYRPRIADGHMSGRDSEFGVVNPCGAIPSSKEGGRQRTVSTGDGVKRRCMALGPLFP
jgi:hypothetical protein